MELASKYNPAEVEGKWYKYWMDNNLFASKPDGREPYCIVIPPPNVTGVLHMGHMLNNTIQDILVRRARMLGKNACWVPGTDHASIATEAKVVNKLAAEGIKKTDLSREEFLKHAWQWTDKHGGIILEQLKKLGASCDWERTCFTMDEVRSESVLKVFVDLFEKGLIYRGVRMVNWDPKALTALSDEEVIFKEQQGKLYYLRYKVSPLTPKGGTESDPKYQTARNSTYSLLKENAKNLRKFSTEAESILWESLRGKQIENYKFRRQHVIDEFIVDFVCLSNKLIVEVDGGYHQTPEIQEADKLRTVTLEELGYRVIRFSNEEVISDVQSVIQKIQTELLSSPFGGVEGAEYIVVATTRPETILGDTAICINPNDQRYAWLKGRKVIVPLVNREIPVIQDEYVDVEFGTGCLKVTPAHDVNDYMLGEKYNLETIDIFNDNGTLNAHGAQYAGMDRFDVRKQIEKDLIEADLMEKVEAYTNKVGFSERTDVPIEPKLSMQWFLKMEQLAKPALDSVMNDDIKLVPAKFKNTYRHWMENVKDWCISRQLWWGHRIPAYYATPLNPPEGGTFRPIIIVAESEEKAMEIANQHPSLGGAGGGFSLRQDEDCLDTWFSSWLWPISVFDGINNPENEEIKYYYPTNDLVTGPDILFFWVARMIISGYEYRNEMPFENVYLTGIVRDKLGRKMSKSLGNSPEPLELIETFGADGVRMGMMLAAPAGNDIHFDEALCEQGRNFNNKIWNAFRLVKGWEVDETLAQPESAAIAIKWFDALLNRTIAEVNDSMDKYRISEALMEIYKLFWDEFSSWYLEMVKPAYQQPIDKATYEATLGFFDALLKLLHPYMPFITEELWQATYERAEGESLMTQLLPEAKSFDENILIRFNELKEIVRNIREIYQKNNLNKKDHNTLIVDSYTDFILEFQEVILKLTNVSVHDEMASVFESTFLVNGEKYRLSFGKLNLNDELAKLNSELEYERGKLDLVLKKLNNEKFVANAKESIVEIERKKKSDTESKIATIEEEIKKILLLL
ncbi:MAG: valine--tRNA ligase [Bacteroidales bacterium]